MSRRWYYHPAEDTLLIVMKLTAEVSVELHSIELEGLTLGDVNPTFLYVMRPDYDFKPQTNRFMQWRDDPDEVGWQDESRTIQGESAFEPLTGNALVEEWRMTKDNEEGIAWAINRTGNITDLTNVAITFKNSLSGPDLQEPYKITFVPSGTFV